MMADPTGGGAMPTEMVCHHGKLRRRCEACELADRLEAVEAERDALQRAVYDECPIARRQHLLDAIAERDALAAQKAELEAELATSRKRMTGTVRIADHALDDLLWWSFRYGLGRVSYVVGDIARALIAHRSHLSEHHRVLIVKEIDEAVERGHAGHDCDVREWEAVRLMLTQEPPK